MYAGPVADVEGNKHYELAIAGTSPLIKKVFSEVDFEIEMAPRATAEEFDERSKRFLKRHIPAEDRRSTHRGHHRLDRPRAAARRQRRQGHGGRLSAADGRRGHVLGHVASLPDDPANHQP